MNIIGLGSGADRLGVFITAAPDEDLGRPTPCCEYSVGDLLDHIAGVSVAIGGAATKAGGGAANMGSSGDAGDLGLLGRDPAGAAR